MPRVTLRRGAAALVLLIAVLPSACGRRHGAGPSAHGTPADTTFAAAAFQRGRSPEEISEAGGRAVYTRYCAICHGDSGQGDGFNAYNVKAAFGVTPTSFADSTFARVPRERALAAVRGGGGAVGQSAAMPPWGGTLTPGEIEDVVQYIRSLAHPAHP